MIKFNIRRAFYEGMCQRIRNLKLSTKIIISDFFRYWLLKFSREFFNQILLIHCLLSI